ncbi:permease-like cell division protein FtsX [bacterium]|jgi:cell division transport system permease protein|nr:permease-like cell division protein FtsX [bacterium]MDB9931661.1 permease-like cell division protein FtsX [Flavobacteriales bacterium]
MAFILFLLLIFGMAIMRLDKIYGQEKEKIEIDVFFRENAKTSQMKKVEKEIAMDYRVNSTEYIPKEKAWESIKEEIGSELAEEIAEGNPLYNSVNLTLKKEYAVLDSVEIFEQNLTEKHEDIISEISYSKAHFLTINETLYNGLWYALGFCSILIIIAVVLINNTIRLAIFSKRFLIRTMQFVGAKHSFIQKPFLLNSITQGILSALLAILIYIVMSLFLENYNSYIGELVFKPENMNTNLIMFAIITGIGVLVSFGSTFFSMKKYLKLSQDELYKR